MTDDQSDVCVAYKAGLVTYPVQTITIHYPWCKIVDKHNAKNIQNIVVNQIIIENLSPLKMSSSHLTEINDQKSKTIILT